MEFVTALLDACLRAATPLALAALGELIIERSGRINIGLEGSVLAGALGGAIVAQSAGAVTGLLGGGVAGAALGALFAAFVVTLRADQIITGTAVTLLSLGMTATIARLHFGAEGIALTLPTLPGTQLLGIERIPLFGPAVFGQPLVFHFTVAAAFALHWWLFRTHAGLALRAVGESAAAAEAAGVRVDRARWFAILVGSSLAGLSGAVLVLAQAGTFVEGMSAGRGFIAIAIVALGRWKPLPVLGAAVLFGFASALQFAAQALGWRLPYQLFLAAPYVITLAVLAMSMRDSKPPAALGARVVSDSF
jgi:simple sugar transport system permease protein